MLPKNDVPIYEITLPLTGEKIKIRPFLVKEEKILLMAMESNDDNAILLAIKQMASNCCLSEITIEDLPILDLEYLFLQLRSRSIGEIIELQYKCNNNVTDENSNEKKCGNIINVNFNALEVEPEINPDHNKKIQITDKLGVVMKYPNFKIIESVKELSSTETVMKIMTNCIDYVYDNESIYHSKDVTHEELVDFIDSLTKEQFNKIQNFFETIPKMKKKLEFSCGKCGYNEEIILEGIQSFFV
jgi:hypothetical protein